MILDLENYIGNLTATWKKQTLYFKKPSGTSRGVLLDKDYYIVSVFKSEVLLSTSEVSYIKGLSVDDENGIEIKLDEVCADVSAWSTLIKNGLFDFPAIKFALEMSLLEIQGGERFQYFDNTFLSQGKGIPINGLIWMGTEEAMKSQIEVKLSEGFKCVKLKIGAIDFNQELALLEGIRSKYNKHQIELRVDANGAFSPKDAMDKLSQLSKFDLHSIEQPIKQGQIEEMRDLCKNTPLDIALDEELIGVNGFENKKALLESIKPQYIILKPSLLGGFIATKEWIDIAEAMDIKWWITSALESNIGLNAIAQFTSYLNTDMYQGLGTGGLYENNIASPLEIRDANLFYNPSKQWGI